MSRPKALPILLTLLETEGPFVGDGLIPDPGGAIQALFEELGLLKRAPSSAFSDWALCDSCGTSHAEPVLLLSADGEALATAAINCPEVGTYEAPFDGLQHRTIDFAVFASRLADALETAGARRELIGGRLWLLGRLTIGRVIAEVFFARGCQWPDAEAVLMTSARLQEPGAKLLLVPQERPLAPLEGASVVARSLDELLSIQAGSLVIDRGALDLIAFEAGEPAAEPKVRSLPVPEGTGWAQVQMWIDEKSLTVKIGRRKWTRDFAEAGFVDVKSRGKKGQRVGSPSHLWRFLRELAKRDGILESKSLGVRERNALRQKVVRLRAALRLLIPVEGDPIPLDDKGRYECAFRLRSGEPPTLDLPEISAWKELTLVLSDNLLEVQVDRMDGSSESRSIGLREMGLADADDVPNPMGRALEDFAMSGGAVSRPRGSPAINRLGALLAEAFCLPEPPFRFDRDSERWIPAFGIQGARSG